MMDKNFGPRNEVILQGFLSSFCGYVFCFEPKYFNKSLNKVYKTYAVMDKNYMIFYNTWAKLKDKEF
ncbi:MAG: hypothetical protein ACK56F_13885 [bacterium]